MNDRLAPPPNASQTLRELAELALAGDDAAFETIYARLGRGLERFLARRMGASEAIDELCQRTWVEVWRALHERRYDPAKSAMTTYVYAVGHKIWLQHCRTSRGGPALAPQYDDLAAELLNDTLDISDVLGVSELLEALRGCVANGGGVHGLTEEERQVVLALGDGDSERTLALKLGVAASTVHARKTSAFAKLRRCLAAKGHT